jgi:hypothetical protein
VDQGWRRAEESVGRTMRKFEFRFTVECVGSGDADLDRVEQLIDLTMQDLVYDDEFVAALDEKEALTIQVSRVLGG